VGGWVSGIRKRLDDWVARFGRNPSLRADASKQADLGMRGRKRLPWIVGSGVLG